MSKAEVDNEIQGVTSPEIEAAPAPVHSVYIAEGTGKTAQNEGAKAKEVHNVGCHLQCRRIFFDSVTII
jgi:hypothetical protein